MFVSGSASAMGWPNVLMAQLADLARTSAKCRRVSLLTRGGGGRYSIRWLDSVMLYDGSGDASG